MEGPLALGNLHGAVRADDDDDDEGCVSSTSDEDGDCYDPAHTPRGVEPPSPRSSFSSDACDDLVESMTGKGRPSPPRPASGDGGLSVVRLLALLAASLASIAASFHAGRAARPLLLGWIDHGRRGSRTPSPPSPSTCDAVTNEEDVGSCPADPTKIQQATMLFDDVDDDFDLSKMEDVMVSGRHWADRLLSYHCREDGRLGRDRTGFHCFGSLDYGGHVSISSVPSSGRRIGAGPPPSGGPSSSSGDGPRRTVHFIYYGGSRTIGTNGAVEDVSDLIASVERLVLGPDAPRYSSEWTLFDRLAQFEVTDYAKFTNDPLRNDLGLKYLTDANYRKEPVASVRTRYQQIDVWDFLHPKSTTVESYRQSLDPDPGSSYEASHPELYMPDRVVFLDGVQQSTSRGDEAYHEALVHPGMFAHPDPRRVAIIGGGEGATLREVLRHDTVEHVKMIEIDEVMVTASAEHLPRWNSCSDVEGSADSCFDDPRADVVCQDAMAWFVDRFIGEEDLKRLAEWAREEEEKEQEEEGEEESDDSEDEEEGESDDSDDSEDEESDDPDEEEDEDSRSTVVMFQNHKLSPLYGTEEPFDFIIMDALDPDENVEFASVLYNDDAFFLSLYNSLSDDGVLVMQLSYSPWNVNPPEEMSELREAVKAALVDLGFESLHEYAESHCGFFEPWTYLLACKSAESCRRTVVRSNPAAREVSIHKRLRRTRSGRPMLGSVDGPTLTQYEVPPKSHEVVFCRSLGSVPMDCEVGRGYDPDRARYYSVEEGIEFVRGDADCSGGANVTKGNVIGGKVLAKVDIPKGSYIEAGEPVFFGARTMDYMNDWSSVTVRSEGKNKFSGFFSPGILAAIARSSGDGEKPGAAVNVGDLATYLFREGGCSEDAPEGTCHAPRNLVVDRHLATYGAGMMMALRDISAGEEIVVG